MGEGRASDGAAAVSLDWDVLPVVGIRDLRAGILDDGDLFRLLRFM